jgi:hypothetical protein
MRDAVSEHPGLTTAGTSNDQKCPAAVFNSLALLRVQSRKQCVWVILFEEV